MLKKLLLYFALLLWFVVPSQAQPAISIVSPDNVQNGEEIEVEIHANDFESIVGIQFSVNWDKDIFAYDTLGTLSLFGLTEFNFGTTEIDDGILRLAWTDPTLLGISIEDGALFTLKFIVIGTPPSIGNIEITDDPIDIELIDTSSVSLDYELVENGMIIVSNPTSLNVEQPIESGNLILYQNFPNPFVDFTNIRFKLKHPNTTTLTVYDINGKKCYELTQHYIAGFHTIKLDSNQLPARGSYIYELSTPENIISRKLISNN